MIATNARLLAGTPHWLRPGTVPRTDQYLLSHVDPGTIDALKDPSVPDRMTGPGFTRQVAGRKWRKLVELSFHARTQGGSHPSTSLNKAGRQQAVKAM